MQPNTPSPPEPPDIEPTPTRLGLLSGRWRWFLLEFSVVALGVLTALGLEQAIGKVRETQRVALAREAVDEELRLNVSKATLLLDAMDCQRAQVQILQREVSEGDVSAVRQALEVSALAPGTTWNDAAWKAAIASGLSDYFDPESRLTLAVVYQMLGAIRERNEDFLNAQDRLKAIAMSDLVMAPGANRAMLDEMIDLTAALESSPPLLGAFVNLSQDPLGIEMDPERQGAWQFRRLQTACRSAAAAMADGGTP